MRRAGLLTLALCVSVVVTACESADLTGTTVAPSAAVVPESDFAPLDHEAMVAEFATTAANLEMPAGVVLQEPTDPGPELLPDGTTGSRVYEPGFGLAVAQQQWFCAWEREWLHQRGMDPVAESAALTMMHQYLDSESFLRFDDPGSTQPAIREMLQKADLGDPTLVSADVTNNCG